MKQKIIQVASKAKKSESIDLYLTLAPKKNSTSKATAICVNQENYNASILLVDLKNQKAEHQYTYSELLTLQTQNRKKFKKLIKNSNLITLPSNSAKILKSFGKFIQLSNKLPIFMTEVANLQNFRKKQYIRVEKNRVQCKLGGSQEDPKILQSRIRCIIETLKEKALEIKKIYIKTTQGSLIHLDYDQTR